jgi:O-antigen/teichoic acid export membrane protein
MLRNTSVLLSVNSVTFALRIVSSIVLTRLLSAADFGAIGVITSIVYVFALLSDVGYYAYVVKQVDDPTPRLLDEVWTIRLVRGIVLAGIIACLSPVLADFFQKPALAPLIAASGMILLLESATSMVFATAARAGRIQKLSLMDLLAAIMQFVVAIGASLLFKSYWALFASMVAASLFKVALSYIIFNDAKRRVAWSLERLRDMWQYGKYLSLSSATQIVSNQTDKILFARLMTIGQFGLYSLAANLASAPAMMLRAYSTNILFPVFARHGTATPAIFARVYYDTGRPFRMLFAAGSGFLFTGAPAIVAILYDDRYLGAATFLSLLAIPLLVNMAVSSASDALLARADLKHSAQLGVMRLFLLPGISATLYPSLGMMGVLYGLIAVELAALSVCWAKFKLRGLFDLKGEAILLAPSCLGGLAGFLVTSVFSVSLA